MARNGTKVPPESRPSAGPRSVPPLADSVGVTPDLARRQQRRRRAQAHRCPACSAVWTLRVTHHPSGVVVVCQVCGFVRLSAAQNESTVERVTAPPPQRAPVADDGVVVPLRRVRPS
jgi:Zn ribbon nucleic-acid-binding protein